MKVALGMFYHEANSFNPKMVEKDDFVYVEGQEVIDRMFASEVFQDADAELVPLIYCNTLPNGIVRREAYDFYSNRILEILSENKDVDGVMLHLHGSMEVEGLGSGEYDLLKKIRQLLGPDVIIGIALDAHANTHPEFCKLVNAVRNYRTIPHTDQNVTEQTVARHMVKCIQEGRKTVPQFVRLPYAIHAEKATMATWPLSEIYEKLWKLEERQEVAIATLGIGMMWCDCETLATNVAVTPSKEEYTDYCKALAKELADYVYGLRDSFDFEQLPLSPHEAARYSVRFEGTPVYVSDSGDNTTGGAVGDHTIMLREYLNLREYYGKKILVTTIWDENALAVCMEHKEGDEIEISIGHDYDENTKAVLVKGKIKKKGKLRGYMGCEDDEVGDVVTIETEHVDIVLCGHAGSFISVRHFTDGAGLNMDDYQVIVVKQGYLFAELRKLAKLAILALTPGGTHQLVENLEYHNIKPPVYPLQYVPK
ncbi:MAG: M81 family metallopeptidase [Lachnospiraceae bacterium]